MKRTIVTLAALLAAAGIAHAQTSTTPTSPSTTTPPSSGSTATAPGSGAMTQTSAKSKIEASGYSNVKNLKQDTKGQWTAEATKAGKQVAVMVDSAGMVKEAQQ
jgi:putative membrane protein